MQLVSAFQLMQGFKMDQRFSWGSPTTALVQPLQMLPYDKKTDEWRAWNMDWLELRGLEQIRMKYKSLTKNYNLANGIIDKTDYIIEEDNENKDLIDALTRDSDPAGMTELQFFPIIPNVVDLLVGEFMKRNNRVIPYAVDELSQNEKLTKKKELVEQVLIQQAQVEVMQNLIEMGVELDSEEAMQQLAPESIKTLPDVERFMRKSYRSTIEQWASHQINADRLRFRMDELEARGFRDSLITDQEFWEIVLLEDDYMPRLLDPRTVFVHKSPGKRYVSEGNFAGYIELMTLADVIDIHGWKMSEQEIRSLESIYPSTNSNFLLNQPNDGSYYDPTKSYEENVKTGSLQFKQLMAFEDAFGPKRGSTTLFDFLFEGENNTLANRDLFRVTTAYWKSQKRVGHLTKIDETGELIQSIVSEDFEVTEKPLYDTTFFKEKTKDTLVFGEHIDWIWINETWGGIKIGRNSPTSLVQGTRTDPDPIYLGIGDKKRPDRLPFQFKSGRSLYGAPLPIEGVISSDRSSMSMPMASRMKPFQVSFNMVNNQISDILIDELGTVIVIDQNMLPQHSLGESWGKNNLAKAYVAMKNFQILPLDTSLTNTEAPTHFNNLTKLDASQTERLLGKVQLAEYFKNQALATIGITVERMGTVNSQQTATGTQTAVNNSYAQTEKYFTQHSDYLMPRVWELMLSASQYYSSTGKQSITLSYRNERDEEVIWELPDTADIFPRDIDVHCTTSFERKELKRKLEQLAIENNTTGASIYDLGRIFTLDTPTEILEALQESEMKMLKQKEQDAKYQQELQEQMLAAQAEKDMRDKAFEAEENEKDRRAKILSDQIRAAGYPDTSDNGQDEYLSRLEMIQSQREYQDTMDLKREQESQKTELAREQMNLKREELLTKKEISDNQLRIARENQTKAEIEKRKKAKEAKKKK